MALIFTTLGEIEESLLEKRTGVDENDHERSQWEEYWKDGVCGMKATSVSQVCRQFPRFCEHLRRVGFSPKRFIEKQVGVQSWRERLHAIMQQLAAKQPH